jgi:hypothetical protein
MNISGLIISKFLAAFLAEVYQNLTKKRRLLMGSHGSLLLAALLFGLFVTAAFSGWTVIRHLIAELVKP